MHDHGSTFESYLKVVLCFSNITLCFDSRLLFGLKLSRLRFWGEANVFTCYGRAIHISDDGIFRHHMLRQVRVVVLVKYITDFTALKYASCMFRKGL